jgi:predicted Rossmann-fold nucleotide-binding protein
MNRNNPNPIRVELESLDRVRARLNDPAAAWSDVVIQSVDLMPLDEALGKADIAGCHFLGCDIGRNLADAIARANTHSDSRKPCLVFPKMPWLPFNPYRSSLYQPEELLGRFESEDPVKETATYEGSLDWQCYLTYVDPKDAKAYGNDSVDTVLARRLHDTAISDALGDLLAPIRDRQPGAQRGIVAIMGGHDMMRLEKVKNGAASAPVGVEAWEAMTDDAVYTRIALLAWKLANEGYLLVSGGGPGAMEATNLGAYFASRPLDDLRAAIRKLEDFKKFFRGKSAEWLIPAMSVRRMYPLGPADELKCRSVGIPTWFYGHEPPNPFATHIAKYFENSVREEGLLAIASHGVIFAEGNAGTVQEIFQDAAQNYYSTYGTAAPMILFGRDYWDPPAMPSNAKDKRKKVYPLARKLAEEKEFTDQLIVSDSLREIVAMITNFQP